jgi:ubiquinone/menaquinone biosynthesis C-methylase UbiE
MTSSPEDTYGHDTRSALQAKEYAQWIAFAPSVFQAARTLRDTGILSAIDAAGETGLTQDEIVARVSLSRYGVRVLLEAGLGIGLLLERSARYTLARTGWFLLHDRLTRVNMDFSHHVNYRGMFALEDAVRSGRPQGLREFGDWNTIYEGLAHLPDPARNAWLAFDHFFSDAVFPAALPLVFRRRPQRLLDIGGNTGKWAMQCVGHDPEVEVTVLDLPGQLAMAQAAVEAAGLTARVHFAEADLLDQSQALPGGFDAVWMSQFLDCFAEAQIVSILRRCHEALRDDGRVYILESFWDRQRFAAAAFCMQQTSLYFTAMANGNSQMYRYPVFVACIAAAGFKVEEVIDDLGVGSTLLVCRPQPGASGAA